MKVNIVVFVLVTVNWTIDVSAVARSSWRRPVSRVSGQKESQFSVDVRQTIAGLTKKEYCRCSTNWCKCCRQLAPPMYVPKSGLGCARFKYMDDQTVLVTLKFDDAVLWSKKVSSIRSTPVCIPLPGDYLTFCGRAYAISRNSEPLKVCLVINHKLVDGIPKNRTISCFQLSARGLQSTTVSSIPDSLAAREGNDLEYSYTNQVPYK